MEAIRDLKQRFNVQRVIVVGDRGMMGKRTLDLLEELKLQYILGVRMRSIKLAPEIIADPSPFVTVEEKDNLKVKEVTLNDNRYIICLNEEEAKRDVAVRKQIEEKLRKRLEHGSLKDLIGNSEYKRYLNVVAEAATINEEKLKQAELFDGLYILQTNTQLPAAEVATAYKDLWQIERAFRNLKSTLDLRPVFTIGPKSELLVTSCFASWPWLFRLSFKSSLPSVIANTDTLRPLGPCVKYIS